jgi:hypothetical protein
MMNEMTMHAIFQHIPHDVLNIILSYDGSIKYRRGKYMNQISEKDERYQLLLTIPKCKTILTSNGQKGAGHPIDHIDVLPL